jgi:hypothetical protein
MSPTDSRLNTAEFIALERLITIARDSACEREARLAAESIFTIRRGLQSEPESEAHQPPENMPAPAPETPDVAAASASPEPHAHNDKPLSTDELADLMIFLPHVKPQRFVHKHSPSHWRQVLQTQRRLNPTIARAIGPPTSSQAA